MRKRKAEEEEAKQARAREEHDRAAKECVSGVLDRVKKRPCAGATKRQIEGVLLFDRAVRNDEEI